VSGKSETATDGRLGRLSILRPEGSGIGDRVAGGASRRVGGRALKSQAMIALAALVFIGIFFSACRFR